MPTATVNQVTAVNTPRPVARLLGSDTFQQVLGEGSSANATSYTTTGLLSSVGDRLYLAYVTGSMSATPRNVSTFTGGGLSWEKVTDIGTSSRKSELWRAALTTPGSGGALTITWDGAMTGFGIIVVEVANPNMSGSNGSAAIIQSGTTTASTGTTGQVTLSTLSSHAVFAAYDVNTDDSILPEAGYTAGPNVDGSGPAFTALAEWRKDILDSTPAATWTKSASSRGIAVEIALAVAHNITLNTATETEQALQVSPPATYAINQITGTNKARPIGAIKSNDRFQQVLSHWDTSNLTTYTTTPSLTAVANRLYLAYVTGSMSASPRNVSTFTGGGLTWVKINEATTSTRKSELWRAMSASPGAGSTLTITWDGAMTGFGVIVVEADQMSTAGTNGSGAIVQSAANTQTGVTSASLTLPSLTRDAVFAAYDLAVDESPISEAGYTHGGLLDGSGPSFTALAQWRSNITDNTPSITWTTSASWRGVAVELAASAAPHTLTLNQATSISTARRISDRNTTIRRLGGYAGSSTSDTLLHDYEDNFIGHPVSHATWYPGGDTWNHITGATGSTFSYWSTTGGGSEYRDKSEIAVHILPKTDPVDTAPTLALGASGSYDSKWSTFASNLISRGYAETGTVIVRLGWEFSGSWTAEYIGVNGSAPANYATYWRRIIDICRAAFASANKPGVRWCWSPARDQVNPEPAYPGDGYVDIIGLSFYDSLGTPFQQYIDETYGINWQVNFARDHNKALGISEWGADESGGDNPQFAIDSYAWFRDNGYEYWLYFDAGNAKIRDPTTTLFPNFRAQYQSIYYDTFTPGTPGEHIVPLHQVTEAETAQSITRLVPVQRSGRIEDTGAVVVETNRGAVEPELVTNAVEPEPHTGAMVDEESDGAFSVPLT